MKCQKCGSENVNVQLVNKQEFKIEKHSLIWWLIIGWWWIPIKWVVLYVILSWVVIPFKMLLPKKKKLINTVEGYKVCNNCGHHWN